MICSYVQVVVDKNGMISGDVYVDECGDPQVKNLQLRVVIDDIFVSLVPANEKYRKLMRDKLVESLYPNNQKSEVLSESKI